MVPSSGLLTESRGDSRPIDRGEAPAAAEIKYNSASERFGIVEHTKPHRAPRTRGSVTTAALSRVRARAAARQRAVAALQKMWVGDALMVCGRGGAARGGGGRRAISCRGGCSVPARAAAGRHTTCGVLPSAEYHNTTIQATFRSRAEVSIIMYVCSGAARAKFLRRAPAQGHKFSHARRGAHESRWFSCTSAAAAEPQ